MAQAKKKKGMSREEAAQLYDTLKKSMEAKYGRSGLAKLIDKERDSVSVSKGKPTKASPSVARDMSVMSMEPPSRVPSPSFSLPTGSGFGGAIGLLVVCALLKFGMAVLEVSGIVTATPARASIAQDTAAMRSIRPQFSREEVQILTKLDSRRAELEERSKKLDERAEDLSKRDREFAAKLTQLRELTERLKTDRVKNDRKRSAQLDQLANVYGSMNPKESAELIEQLDVTIALQLIERMPEKRIGQILALMSPERALAITRMLSGK